MANGIDQAIKPTGVLLLGASSQIGIFAIPRLVRAGFKVFAVSRKGKPERYPDFDQVTWLNEASAVQASQSCQYLLSAGPLELAEKFLLCGGQFQSVVVFSSSSVESKQGSDNPLEKRLMLDMLALESSLQQTAKSAAIRLLIFRPTLIYGCGLDANISRMASWIHRFGFIPVNGKAAGLRQPVHADDLASVALTAMLNKDQLPQVLSLRGGDTLTFSEMVIRIFAAMEKRPRLLRLPEWLFVLLVKLAGYFRAGDGVNSEMVKRQKVDLVFDDRLAREILDYDPRPFTPTAKDFSLPDFQKSIL